MTSNKNIEIRYNYLCERASDINEHLSTLVMYGKQVDHITEFGVRSGVSTVAFLHACPEQLISYDINLCSIAVPKEYGFKFIQADVLNIEIEETELLFIDTYHTYEQLSQELSLHGDKSRFYLIFHDTETFGTCGEDGSLPGLMVAIREFMFLHPWWTLARQYKNNNGLTILKRRGAT